MRPLGTQIRQNGSCCFGITMPRGFHHCNSWYWLVLSEGAYTCHIIFVIFISCLYNIYICVVYWCDNISKYIFCIYVNGTVYCIHGFVAPWCKLLFHPLIYPFPVGSWVPTIRRVGTVQQVESTLGPRRKDHSEMGRAQLLQGFSRIFQVRVRVSKKNTTIWIHGAA